MFESILHARTLSTLGTPYLQYCIYVAQGVKPAVALNFSGLIISPTNIEPQVWLRSTQHHVQAPPHGSSASRLSYTTESRLDGRVVHIQSDINREHTTIARQ